VHSWSDIKLLALPPQPPYTKLSQALDVMLKKYLGKYARHIPDTAGS